MFLRKAILLGVLMLSAAVAAAQPAPAMPDRPFSVGAIGGLSAGQGQSGGSVGASFAFDVTDRIGFDVRGIHEARGSGETGGELTATMFVTLARARHAAPYVGAGGGLYRSSFDLGDSRFFGMMNGQYAVGTQFMPIQGMNGFAMMYPGVNYGGMMLQGPWTGPTFDASRMPMFYANRLGQMMVPGNGQWGTRSFTDPALTVGGGVKFDLTNRLYLNPDVRGIIVLSGGDHMTLMTMNVGFGVRF